MKFSRRIAFFIVLLVNTGITCFSQTPAKDATASIAGRVTISGKAAPGVTVVATFSSSFFDNRTIAKTVTDQDGNYKLTGLTAGKFQVFPLARAYVSNVNAGFKEAGQSVDVAEGEAITRIDFPLLRGGVITGRITDAEEHPLIGERVNVTVKGAQPDNGPQMVILGSSRYQTDDRGIYRLYGLAPGSYIVSVGQSAGGAVSIMGMSGSQYLRTFYPGVQDESRATVVEIKEGSEIKDVNISVAKPDAGHSVSGRVVDGESGQPVANVYIAHSALNESGQLQGSMQYTGNQSDSNGKFKLEGLKPGHYAVFTLTTGENKTSYGEPTTFEISETDVTGIEIKLRRGGAINGVALVENNSDPAVTALLQSASLYAYVEQKGVGASTYATSQIGADGSFHFSGLAPGKAHLELEAFPVAPKGLTLVRTELEGVNQPDGVEVAAGGEVNGVRLVFAYGTGSVRGFVILENGPPPEGMNLQVFARSASGDSRRLHRESGLDARLQFVLENLPPGDVELLVRGMTSAPQGGPPTIVEFLKQTVSVSNGTETKVNLVVDLKKGTQP